MKLIATKIFVSFGWKIFFCEEKECTNLLCEFITMKLKKKKITFNLQVDHGS